MMESSPTSEQSVGGGGEMSEAIMKLVRPSVDALDEQVRSTRHSQISLANNISQLSEHLKSIADEQSLPYSLDAYVQRLDESRQRVASASARLAAVHERMDALQRNIVRETFRKKQSVASNK